MVERLSKGICEKNRWGKDHHHLEKGYKCAQVEM
jgi:hypothetical protein